MPSTAGDDTDLSTVADEKTMGQNEKNTSQSRDDSPRHDVDLEAQGGDLGVRRLQSNKSEASQTHRSILSRLSLRRTKTAEKHDSDSNKRPPSPPLPAVIIPVSDLANGVVGWEGQDDPDMPLNFSARRKWLTVSALSCITFMSPFASSILAPAITSVAREFGRAPGDDLTLASMPVSIFLLGWAVGPLLLSPLSETWGRNVVVVAASAWFCAWLVGCALAPSLGALIFFRFMCGVGGSASQTVGGAVVADMFPVARRGRAMTLWMLGPMFGPSCAPVIGGYVSQTIGWRWVHWITFIPAALIVVAMSFLNRETNHHVLIRRKTARLRRELGRPELRSCYVDPAAGPPPSTGRILLNGLVRPLRMLFTSVIIFASSLYVAFALGCLYLLFNTIPVVFQGTYGWDIGTTGLVYLSLLVGYAVGLAAFSSLSDRTVVRMTAANAGVYEPEMRLPDCIWFALVLPVTFFWYGWSAAEGVHWIVPVVGIVPFGVGIIGVMLPTQAYIVDAYPQYAASGLAAFSVMRCTVAAFLPLAGPRLYEALGVGWGTSLLGFIAIALIPVPTVIYKYGKVLREKWPLRL